MKNKKPVIRFKGFSEEWEEKELNKLSILITKGTTPLDKKSSGTINYVKIENINSTSGEITITSKITEQEHENYLKRSQLKEDDILFSIAGTLGRVTVVNKNILPANTNQALAIIRLTNSSISFVTTYLKGRSVSEFVKRNPTVGAQPNLSLQQVGSLEIPLPSKTEQTQIGNFFKNLDNLITLHQRKYEKLGDLKKAMLEKMFPKNGANVPEIRFKGFTEAWEERKLGNLFGIASASRVHKHEWTESGVPFFRSSDVVSDYKGQENTKAFISFELYEELSKKSGCVQKNDILITGGGSIGIPYLIKSNEPLYFKDADLLWLKNSDNINGYYLYIFFSTSIFREYINSITHTGTISHYTIEQARVTPIKVPQREEQEKIGTYFKNLDDLLRLYEKELEKLKNLKKALLEKMFV